MKAAKLCLGTVQFGLSYGINNRTGIPGSEELKEIFVCAHQSGMTYFDTAPVYGDAQKKISEYAAKPFHIITKFPPCSEASEIINSFRSSLADLKEDSVYALLAHDADSLISHPMLWNELQSIRKNGQASKIGYSLYSPIQLEKLLELGMTPDLVQLPYSILDRKFETYFTQLKKLGVEIHVRSVFLQGLYFKNPNELPEKLSPLREALISLHSHCHESNAAISSLALNFSVQNEFIDKVVIGVDTIHQLQQNIRWINEWNPERFSFSFLDMIRIDQPELLNPRNW